MSLNPKRRLELEDKGKINEGVDYRNISKMWLAIKNIPTNFI